jgi:hypothetical protein
VLELKDDNLSLREQLRECKAKLALELKENQRLNGTIVELNNDKAVLMNKLESERQSIEDYKRSCENWNQDSKT